MLNLSTMIRSMPQTHVNEVEDLEDALDIERMRGNDSSEDPGVAIPIRTSSMYVIYLEILICSIHPVLEREPALTLSSMLAGRNSMKNSL